MEEQQALFFLQKEIESTESRDEGICQIPSKIGLTALNAVLRVLPHVGTRHDAKKEQQHVAQITALQEHNTKEVERRRRAEGQVAVLKVELASQNENGADLRLILKELTNAQKKHPRFAISMDQALVVLSAEQGELAAAILKGNLEGEHGVIAEAAQVAAVALRIIEMAHMMLAAKAAHTAFAEKSGPCTCGWCMGCQDRMSDHKDHEARNG